MDELMAEGMAGYAHSYGAILGYEMGAEGGAICLGIGEDHRGGPVLALQQGDGLGSGVGNVGMEHLDIAHEHEHALAGITLLDGIEPLDGTAVGGIAAYAPDGVGGVEECVSLQQGLGYALDVFDGGHRVWVRVSLQLQKYKEFDNCYSSFQKKCYICILFCVTKVGGLRLQMTRRERNVRWRRLHGVAQKKDCAP